MQKLLLILSLIAIVLQTLSLPFLAFRLEKNRETEAVPMCVNQDKPELACFGSCYINQHLSEAMAQDMGENDASIPVNLQAQPLIAVDYSISNTPLPVPAKQDRCYSLNNWHATLLTKGVWHPPKA